MIDTIFEHMSLDAPTRDNLPDTLVLRRRFAAPDGTPIQPLKAWISHADGHKEQCRGQDITPGSSVDITAHFDIVFTRNEEDGLPRTDIFLSFDEIIAISTAHAEMVSIRVYDGSVNSAKLIFTRPASHYLQQR